MPSDSPPRIKKRKQRVDVACDFCRQRKLGCNNGKPKCENCHVYQKDCTYAARSRKEKSSSSRINQVNEESIHLRPIVEDLGSASSTEQTRMQMENQQMGATISSTLARASGETSSDQRATIGLRNVPVSTEIDLISQSPKTGFHGPTSAMFDGEHAHGRKKADSSFVSDASRKTELLAQAVKQRMWQFFLDPRLQYPGQSVNLDIGQLELVNFRSGKLKFDGIEPQLGMDLLSIFWNRQHATGSVVYRPCFMRDMASQGPYYSSLLLNAIFFVASKNRSMIGDSCSLANSFRSKMEHILYDPSTQVLCKSRITTIQALLLLSDALFSWCDERSLSWHYLGIAINMIIDLGIHSQNSPSNNSNSPEDLETRRRVFWAAFVLDKIQSIYQGRPARLRAMDSSIPVVFLDEYEELEPFDTLGYSASPKRLDLPTHSVSTFEHLCKLSTIADRILCNVYTEESSKRDHEDLFRTSKLLHTDLVRWHESLPAHLSIKFDSSGKPITSNGCVALPHTLSLIVMFHALKILLHRPFVADGHLKSGAESATSSALSLCQTAASEIDVILRWYKTQWCIKSPPYFVSYATYVSATIHARIASQKPRGSKAHRCLLNCLEILSEHQKVCDAPRQAMGILLGLIKRLKVDVGDVFTTLVAHDAPCKATRLENNRSSFDPSSVHETPSTSFTLKQAHSLDTADTVMVGDSIQLCNTRSDPDEAISTNVAGNLPSLTDIESQSLSSGWDEQLPDMNFDFDPLFGFDIFQMDSDAGL